MRFKVIEVKVKRALSPSGLPDIDYALNPYLGCIHGCAYCYAKMYTRVKDVVNNWGSIVVVKRNIVDVLRREVRKVRKGLVGIGTITDPYQPIEALYKISRSCIEILAKNGFRVSIQTKSSLILRDIDILRNYRDIIDVGITITSARNSSRMRTLEPYSSPPLARIEALKRISREGIKTWIFYGPIVPGYNDDIEEISEILNLAKETNSDVYIDKLRVKRFMWLDPLFRDIAKKSIEYDWDKLFKSVFDLCKSIKIVCKTGFEPS